MAVGQSEQTDTDVVNLAMDLLGQSAISNINEPQLPIEKTLQRVWPIAQDTALKKHWWTPLRQEALLPALHEPDETGLIEVQLPQDCLQVWTVNGSAKGWERRQGQGAGVIAGHLYVPAKVVYAARLAVGQWPSELMLYVAAELAVLMASTQHVDLSRADRRDLLDEREDRMLSAMDILGIEGGEVETVPSRFMDAVHGVSS